MRMLDDVYSRSRSVRRGCIVFLACTCIIISSVRDGLTQQKPWSLRVCIEHAREHNLQVEYARVSLENTLVESSRAKAQQLPSLDFSSTQGWGHQKKAGTNGTLKSSSAYTGSYSLSGNMTLYQGGKLSRSIRQQELLEKAVTQDVLVAQNDIEISVTKAYLQILYANETLKTDRQTLESSGEQLARSKALLDAGSISASDFAQMESQYSSDQYRVVQAENDLAFSKLQLKQLLELEPEEEFDVVFPELDEESVLVLIPGLQDVYREALRLMPEVKSSQLNVESAIVGEKIARGDYLPSVSLSASVSTGYDSKGSGSYFSQIDDRLVENIGINISIPITNRKKARLNVSKARLQTEQSRLDEQNTRKNLLQTVESLHQDVVAAQSRYMAANQRVKSAYTSYRQVQEEFDAGMKNPVDLLVEKNNYLSALQEQIQAKYQAVLAFKLLNFYRNEPIDI
ncbi:TolC family protein [Butyricimonas sp. Marseille-P3923]|uniref:TolC family protein n=1 Tax=Butyricimonas sp. Marseille-P3923 TaxID=1987504 RepID=UPI000C07A586|nr:TolC family protein [Butyricimonas sp. Marseille-P3923]